MSSDNTGTRHKRSGEREYDDRDEKRNRREPSPKRSGKEVWGKAEENEPPPEEPIVKEKANFGLTGLLSKDVNTGNTVNGVILKWSEPLDSAKPDQQWRLYVFKEDALIETLHLHRQSSYLVGRDNRVADIVVAHPSCSKQHAVIQYRKVKRRDRDGEPIEKVLPYLMDLQSAQKTFVNGEAVDDSRYYELREKDCIKFGASTREYVLMRDAPQAQQQGEK
jgi:smad nuclear-interacting protein 1